MSALYRSKYSFEDAAPIIDKLRRILQEHGKRLINEDSDRLEWYFIATPAPLHVMQEINKYNIYLQAGGFTKIVPTEGGTFIIFNPEANGRTPTVSSTHIRLPKLSHLITLTPSDFFTLLRLLNTAKPTYVGAALQLNLPAAGIDDFPRHILYQFFTMLRTNYVMNVDLADSKWTPRAELPRIANLQPTRENQLVAMQYLTSNQNKDLLYFPVDSMIDLDLEWEQLNNDYARPPRGNS